MCLHTLITLFRPSLACQASRVVFLQHVEANKKLEACLKSVLITLKGCVDQNLLNVIFLFKVYKSVHDSEQSDM